MEKLQKEVMEMANGTQEEMDKKMNNVSKGLYEMLKKKFPEAPDQDIIEFAKASAVAMVRTTAATI